MPDSRTFDPQVYLGYKFRGKLFLIKFIYPDGEEFLDLDNEEDDRL